MGSAPSTSSLPSSIPLNFDDIIFPFPSNEIPEEHEKEMDEPAEPLSTDEMELLLRKADEILTAGNGEVAKMVSSSYVTAEEV